LGGEKVGNILDGRRMLGRFLRKISA